MLESAETGHRISKSEYAHEEPKLREALLNAQYDLSQSGRGPVLLIISGVAVAAGGVAAAIAGVPLVLVTAGGVTVMPVPPRACRSCPASSGVMARWLARVSAVMSWPVVCR